MTCVLVAQAWTLNLAIVFYASTVHEWTPFSDLSNFILLHIFLAFFFTKLESMNLILPRGPYFGQSLNGKGEFDFRGPTPTKK